MKTDVSTEPQRGRGESILAYKGKIKPRIRKIRSVALSAIACDNAYLVVLIEIAEVMAQLDEP